VIVLLVGIPASGKSTLASRLVSLNESDWFISIVSHDQIWQELCSIDTTTGAQDETKQAQIKAWHEAKTEALSRVR